MISYPVTSGLGDVFTNFLGGKTQRTDLGSKSGGGTDLTSGSTEVAIFMMSASTVKSISLDIVAEGTEILLSSAGVNGSRT